MSARDLIHNHIDNTVKNLIHAIASKYNLNEKEVYSLWSSSSSAQESSISSVNTTDFSPERLTKSTVAELKALCKTKGVKCTGKKEELVSRLLGKDEDEVVETKKETKKQKPEKKTASSSLSVIQKLAPTIPTIAIRKNQYGNLVHPDTQFVFDRIHEVVIGKQGENGKVLDLTDEDIQTCKRLKMQYKLPGNLDKNINMKNVKVEGLDESDIEIEDEVEDEIENEDEVEDEIENEDEDIDIEDD